MWWSPIPCGTSPSVRNSSPTTHSTVSARSGGFTTVKGGGKVDHVGVSTA